MDIDAIISIVMLIVAAMGVGIAWYQLPRTVKALEKSAEANALAAKSLESSAESNKLSAESNHVSKLMAVLHIEQTMRESRHRLAEAARDGYDDNQHKRTLIEAYLNSIDRFCSCIRHGLISEDVYRRDYKTLIADAIKENRSFFEAATPFIHIKQVHDYWTDEKTAVDLSSKMPTARSR